MSRSINKINSAKASTSKPLGKSTPGYRSLGLDPDISFYEIEDGDKTDEG